MAFHDVTDVLIRQSGQIAVVFGLVWVFTALARRASAHWRYLLWLVVVAKCLTPPFLSIPIPVLSRPVPIPTKTAAVESVADRSSGLTPSRLDPTAPLQATLADADSDTSDLRQGMPGPAAAVALEGNRDAFSSFAARMWWAAAWVLVAGAMLALVATRIWATHRRLNRSRVLALEDFQCEFNNLAGSLGISNQPKLYVSPLAVQPFVWGLVRGDVYVPIRFFQYGTADQRRAILAHELAHVARYDVAVNLGQVVAQSLFFFHPLVWWANQRIRLEREKCCDEFVLSDPRTKPKLYCDAIVEMLSLGARQSCWFPLLSVTGSIKNIEDRFTTVLAANRKFHRRPTWIAVAVTALAAACLLPTGMILTYQPAFVSAAEPLTQDKPANVEAEKKSADHTAQDVKGNAEDESKSWQPALKRVMLAHSEFGAQLNHTKWRCSVAVERALTKNLKPVCVKECSGVVNQGRMFYHEETHREDQPGWHPLIEEMSYDGERFFRGVRSFPSLDGKRPGTPGISIFLGEIDDDPRAEVVQVMIPFLEAIGIDVPSVIAGWRKLPMKSRVLQCIESGKIRDVREDDSTLSFDAEIPDKSVLRANKLNLDEVAESMRMSPERSKQIHLDKIRQARTLPPTRLLHVELNKNQQYSLRLSEERTLDGKLIKTTSCEDFKPYVGSKVWLPQKCVVKQYVRMMDILSGFTEDPCLVETITLNDMSFDEAPPTDVSFRLDFGPGTVIADRSIAAAKEAPNGKVRSRTPDDTNGAQQATATTAVAQRGSGRGDGRRYLRSNIFIVAVNEAVQTELGLSADEIARANKVVDEYNDADREARVSSGVNSGRKSQADREKLISLSKEVIEEFTPKLKAALIDDHFSRVQQINYQALRASALLEPEVVKALSETAEQQERIHAIVVEYQLKVNAQNLAGGDDVSTTIEEINKERDAKAIEQLTQDQKDKFAALKGREFDITQLNIFNYVPIRRGSARGRGIGADETPKRPQPKAE